MLVFAVDTHLLWQVIWVSALAGDARRAGQGGAAAAFAALAVVAFLLFAAGVVLGVQVMVTK
jgi:hypothetical protein